MLLPPIETFLRILLHEVANMRSTLLFVVLVWQLESLPGVDRLGAQETSKADTPTTDNPVAGNAQVAEFMKNFAGRGVMADNSLPTPAEESVKQFKLSTGFEIDLVASEPALSQPLFLTWDSRGRMWVVQYRQYQFPAGLKIVRYDQHLRAVFDKIPDPPPHGMSGKDIISVFEDTDGDGHFDSHKDVITGLNIATSVQIGHGGIWVLNPPYLLFYPDANGDDVPDSQPEVHLSGFGLQDTHSVANSLLWGPDGWLYGANGSTTVGSVSSAATQGVDFQGQCIWRYHPDSKVFEIYAEGGGNTFSLEIDANGRVFSGTNGGGSRGFYYPQGSYSSKNWGKHGPLTNAYAFGYFEAMKSKGDDRRFPQAFAIYEGGLFPPSFEGNIIAPNSMQNLVWNSRRMADGSTYRTEDAENLCESPDRWFRPVYAGVGPDGSLFIADWYDTRLSHVSPLDDWHKESGRVYRVYPAGSSPNYPLGNLAAKPSEALLELFSHTNKWVRQRAVLELGWRGDKTHLSRLIELIEDSQSLEALWAVNLLGELNSERAAKWLLSDNEHIRRWVVRLLGDRHQGISELADLASRESSPQVRSQLASSAKRLPAAFGLPIIRALLSHSEDTEDPHLPLLIWWAMESHADEWNSVRDLLADRSVWQQDLFRHAIASRLMQRYATRATVENLEHCSDLIQLAPDAAARQQLLVGLTRAFEERTIPTLPPRLTDALQEYQRSLGSSGISIGLSQGHESAINEALKIVVDSSQDIGLRASLIRGLGATQSPRAQSVLLRIAGAGSEPVLQRVALIALRNFSDDSIAKEIVGRLGSSISAEHELRDTACRTLATRKSWCMALLNEVREWRLRASDIPGDVVQTLRAYEDPQVAALAVQTLGKAVSISSADKLKRMKELQVLLSDTPGHAASGKETFTKKCAVCHKLFGEGNAIGPPLDAYERGNLHFWLIATLDPSAEIREGFQSYAVLTEDGRLVSGMIAAQDTNAVTIRGSDNQLTTIVSDDIAELRALKTSLMPEDVLKDLTDQQLRDLFAYMMQGARR